MAPLGHWFSVPRTSRSYEFADVHIATSSLEGDALGFVLRQVPFLRSSDQQWLGIPAIAGDRRYCRRLDSTYPIT